MSWRRLAFRDEVAVLSDVNPVDADFAAAGAGVAAEASRQDHKHSLPTGAPSDIGESNAEGTSTSVARLDHQHNHPNIAADLHNVYLLADGTRSLTGNMNVGQNQLERQVIHRGTEFPDAGGEQEAQLFWRTDALAPEGVGLYAWAS